MSRVEIVADERALQSLRPDWDALLARAGWTAPTLTPPWMLAWWRTFGAEAGRNLHVLTVREGNRLIGLAPLLSRPAFTRLPLPVRRVELLASGEDEADETCSDYIGVLAESGAERSVAEAVCDALARGAVGAWDELLLTGMNGDAPLPLLLASGLRERGFLASLEVMAVAPYIKLPDSFDAYLASLPSQRRYQVRRSERDIERWAKGSLQIHRACTSDELSLGMRYLTSLHAERWAADGQPGVFASPRFGAFHAAVAPELLSRGELALMWITVHEQPVCAAYYLIRDGRVLFYQSGRSLKVPAGIRPGIFLHAIGIRDAIARKQREYDFLSGTARYKTELADDARPIVRLRATRPSLVDTARRAAGLALDQMRALRRGRRRAPDPHAERGG